MKAARMLVDALNPEGYWCGHLSSSALSTATAICALQLYRQSAPGLKGDESAELGRTIRAGAGWLVETQNEDGGWGDTADSPSNISTTLLCWASLQLLERSGEASDPAAVGALKRCRARLRQEAGGLTPDHISDAILRRYGSDRTFSVPILTHCAIAGCFGTDRQAWRNIPSLPFELAALPHRLYQFLGLPMVSYAMPALIAIGQVRHHHSPARNPLTLMTRRLSRSRTLTILQDIQPPNGGFLEATPLTSFVTMSLISMGLHSHPVTRRGVSFLSQSRRDDGSWPIDTNLATWVSTLSINALAAGGRLSEHLSPDQLSVLADHLLGQQYRRVHPFTRAAPGGWAWTHLPGGVPDADDTAGALLALRHLQEAGAVDSSRALTSAEAGIGWLLGLQNRDGGIPTFCRGWGRLPFDRSSPDLTAHALRAFQLWRLELSPSRRADVLEAMQRAVGFLLENQAADGTWVPLWFGNQHQKRQENPVFGTSRVLKAGDIDLADPRLQSRWGEALERARLWLAGSQNPDGGWGAGDDVGSSIEETALAVEALSRFSDESNLEDRISKGLAFLDAGLKQNPPVASPIGLYFARLWYWEKLYPVIFSAAAQETSLRRDHRPTVTAGAGSVAEAGR